jgi:hypothetical protein
MTAVGTIVEYVGEHIEKVLVVEPRVHPAVLGVLYHRSYKLEKVGAEVRCRESCARVDVRSPSC